MFLKFSIFAGAMEKLLQHAIWQHSAFALYLNAKDIKDADYAQLFLFT